MSQPSNTYGAMPVPNAGDAFGGAAPAAVVVASHAPAAPMATTPAPVNFNAGAYGQLVRAVGIARRKKSFL